MLILDGAAQQPQPGSTDTKLQFLVAHTQKKRKPKHVSWWLCLSQACSFACPLIECCWADSTKEKQAPIIVTIISITISFTVHDSCLSWGGPPAVAAENISNRNTSMMMCDTVKSNTVGCRYRGSEHTDNDILYDFLMFAVFTVACVTYLVQSFLINELKVISWGSVSHSLSLG